MRTSRSRSTVDKLAQVLVFAIAETCNIIFCLGCGGATSPADGRGSFGQRQEVLNRRRSFRILTGFSVNDGSASVGLDTGRAALCTGAMAPVLAQSQDCLRRFSEDVALRGHACATELTAGVKIRGETS